MTKQKRLTSKCGITIPKDLRANFGLMGGQAVDLVEMTNGILIRKHVPTCFCCGSVVDVRAYKGYEICGKCVKELGG